MKAAQIAEDQRVAEIIRLTDLELVEIERNKILSSNAVWPVGKGIYEQALSFRSMLSASVSYTHTYYKTIRDRRAENPFLTSAKTLVLAAKRLNNFMRDTNSSEADDVNEA